MAAKPTTSSRAVLDEFEPKERALIPRGAEHSPWQILEHMRLSQRDILDFSQNEKGTYKEKAWPEEYWPHNAAPKAGEWDDAVKQFQAGIAEFEALISDSQRDLSAPFPWGSGQTLLREILLAADHAAYHCGQLVELKRWIAGSP